MNNSGPSIYRAKLKKRITELENAIRHHMNQKGNDACWENDLELWKHIDPTIKYPHEQLPSKADFLAKCAVYRDSLEP